MNKFLLFLAIIAISSCGKKNNEPQIALNHQSLTLYYGDGVKMVATPANPEYLWSSSDDYIATVSSDGELKANHIGKANIFVIGSNSQKAICQVTVLPRSNLYSEPILEFGASMATIKSKEKRRLTDQSANLLLYADSQNDVQYEFDDKTGGLVSSLVFFNPESITLEKLFEFILERYDYLGTSLYPEIHIFAGNGVLVGVYPIDEIVVVIYVAESDNSKSGEAADLKTLQKRFDNQLIKITK